MSLSSILGSADVGACEISFTKQHICPIPELPYDMQETEVYDKILIQIPKLLNVSIDMKTKEVSYNKLLKKPGKFTLTNEDVMFLKYFIGIKLNTLF